MFTQPPYLAGCTVGHAGALIIGQVEVGGTGAFVASSRREETEVTAAAVVCLARVIEHCERDRKIRNVLTSDSTNMTVCTRLRFYDISIKTERVIIMCICESVCFSSLYFNTYNEFLYLNGDNSCSVCMHYIETESGKICWAIGLLQFIWELKKKYTKNKT